MHGVGVQDVGMDGMNEDDILHLYITVPVLLIAYKYKVEPIL